MTNTCTHGSKIFISSLIEAVYGSPWQRGWHTQQPGGRTREGRTSFDDPTHRPLSPLSLLSLSLSSLDPEVSYFLTFPQMSPSMIQYWFIVPPPTWQERKDAPRGDGKDIEPQRNEGGRREESEKDVINVRELLVCRRRRRHAVTRRRTEARWPFIFIERERVDQQYWTECSRLVVCDGNKLVWEVKRWAGTRSHFQHSEFPRSFVNENKADELLSVRDETLGSALLSPRQHIDSSEN